MGLNRLVAQLYELQTQHKSVVRHELHVPQKKNRIYLNNKNISLSSFQVVEYEADERGFKPRISVEPVDDGSGGGYDDNAQDLARGAGGPY